MSNKRHSFFKGFTLVEILFAILITSIIALGLQSVFERSKAIYNSAEKKTEISNNLINVIQSIREELACAYLPADNDSNQLFFSLAKFPDNTFSFGFYTMNPAYHKNPAYSMPAFVTYSFKKGENSYYSATRTEAFAAGQCIIGLEKKQEIPLLFHEIDCYVLVSGSEMNDMNWSAEFSSSKILPSALKLIFYEESKVKHENFKCVFPIIVNSTLSEN